MRLPHFPDGTYFSVIGNVRLGTGGQTRLVLLRHRLFARHTDHELPILTFNPVASYEPVRTGLREQGLLLPDSRLINMHEDLRERELVGTGPASEPVAGGEDDIDDGYVWRRRHTAHWDYLRRDGSVYARTSPADSAGPAALLDREGRTVEDWPRLGGLWQWWASQLFPAEGRVFLLSDSRYVSEELARIDDDRIFVLHQMHNPHVVGERRWNSGVSPTYRSSMNSLGRLDALLSLTDRQRQDIARGYGATSNLFFVPNPVETQALPDPAPPRHPYSIVMVARLTRQKRIDRAIEAFAHVVAARPDATLDIYGQGPLRGELQEQIDAAELGSSIALRGHDPHARESLWEASAFWLTSEFEGYPLSTLEAMSHGCPVLSFDVKYGPREQVDDGVDGYLIEPGDTASLVGRTLELLDDPARVRSMGMAGRDKARAHDHEHFLGDWADVLNHVAELHPLRTTVDKATWDLELMPSEPFGIRGSLRLDTPDRDRLDEVGIGLIAYASDREEVVELPLKFGRDGNVFAVAATVDPEAVAGIARDKLRFRITYVWHNNAGHAVLRLPPASPRRSLRSRVGTGLRRIGLRR